MTTIRLAGLRAAPLPRANGCGMDRRAAGLTLLLACLGQPASATGSAEEAIRKVLMAAFDRPDARLTVDPVVVEGDHAIAGWSQGEMGGRALLRRKGAEWVVWLCAGDGLRSVQALTATNIPHDLAHRLSAALARAEAGLSPGRLALFSRFEGTVMIEGAAHPPAASGHGHAPPHHGAPPAGHGHPAPSK